MDLKSSYFEFHSILTYVAKYAPDQPSGNALTAQKALKQLFERFSDLRPRVKDRGATKLLLQCREELRAGRSAFDAGDPQEGRRRMLQALQFLEAARVKT
jgi:hypothetical protein